MSEFKSLLFLELRSFYGINKFRYTKDKKVKNRFKLMCFAWGYILCMVFFYIGSLVFGLNSIGLAEIIPAYLAVISSAVVLMFSLFGTANKLFSTRNYDILASLPINPRFIIISRFLSLYIGNLTFVLAIMLPGIAVYGYLLRPNVLFYLLTLLGTLLIPAIPLFISAIIGSLILAVSSRFKKGKNLLQTMLSLAVVFGTMLFSFTMGNKTEGFSEEQLISLANTVNAAFSKAYPPAVWLGKAIVNFDILRLLAFTVASLAAAAVTVLLTSAGFNLIVRALSNVGTKHNYKLKEAKNNGVLKALTIREAKRYFSSSIYVTNTVIGPIMATVLSVVLAAIGMDKIKVSIPLNIDIAGLLPFAFTAVFCMMPTTSTSLSLEGKQFWIVKHLPVSAKNLFDAKILFNLILMAPFYLISQIAIIIAIKPDLVTLLWQILIPLLIILFSVIFGITVDLKFHSFDWENEVSVVKQSASAGFGGFAPFFLSLIFGVAIALIPAAYGNMAKIVICALLFRFTYFIYRKNNQKELSSLL